MQVSIKGFSGPWGRTRRPTATTGELMRALRLARAEIPEGEVVTIDRLAELARKHIPAAKETIKTLIGKLPDVRREQVDLPAKKPLYK